MVASANISNKSIHPQEGLDKQKKSSSFLPASSHKFGHNLAIFGCTIKCFAPSCFSRDSASDDVSVIDIKRNDCPWASNRNQIANRQNSHKDFIASLPVSSLAYSITIKNVSYFTKIS